MIIRVLPDSGVVDAICLCYERKRVYHHNGEPYFVTELNVSGKGESTRLEATLEPVWGGVDELCD